MVNHHKRATHKLHQSTIHSFPFSSNKQATTLKVQEQHHWVMHWNPTQHSRNSIWEVNKLKTHKWHSPTKRFFPFLSNQQLTTLEKQGSRYCAMHWNQTQRLQRFCSEHPCEVITFLLLNCFCIPFSRGSSSLEWFASLYHTGKAYFFVNKTCVSFSVRKGKKGQPSWICT